MDDPVLTQEAKLMCVEVAETRIKLIEEKTTAKLCLTAAQLVLTLAPENLKDIAKEKCSLDDDNSGDGNGK
jgi:precorrin-6B methylase 2